MQAPVVRLRFRALFRMVCVVLLNTAAGLLPAAPGGLALIDEGRHLLVPLANEAFIVAVAVGAETTVEPRVKQIPLPFKPGSILALSETKLLLSDPDGGSIYCFAFDPATTNLVGATYFDQPLDIPAPFRPVHLALSDDGKRLGSSSREHHMMLSLRLPNAASPPAFRASGELVFVSHGGSAPQHAEHRSAVLVAPHPNRKDLQVVRPTGQRHRVRLSGAIIENLAVTGEGDASRLRVTGTRINELATTSLADIHWGNLATPLLQSIQPDALGLANSLANSLANILRPNEQRLGKIRDPGTDPAGLVDLGDGRLAIAFGGTDQVGLLGADGTLLRFDTKARPQALLHDPVGQRLFVFNERVRSITLIQLSTGKIREIDLGAIEVQEPAVARGRGLFFNASLSHDRWLTCHTCHRNTGGLDQLVDTLGDGHFGSPKRIPDLRGLADTAPFGWTGAKADLETQLRDTLTSTMRVANHVDEEQVADLAAFLRSLPPPESPTELRTEDTPEKARRLELGKQVFEKHKCARCHKAPVFTSPETYDLGLIDEAGNTRFNPPSLRGVHQRMRLLHDGRAASIRSLFKDHQHQLDTPLSAQELTGLLTFLRSL